MDSNTTTETAPAATETQAPAYVPPAAPTEPAKLETYDVHLTLTVRVTIDPAAVPAFGGGNRPTSRAINAEAQRVLNQGMGAIGWEYPTVSREVLYASLSVDRQGVDR